MTTEVKLDAASNRKILVVSSPVVFVNNTSHHVVLAFQNRKLLGYSYMKKAVVAPG